jgi:hypothetical protein
MPKTKISEYDATAANNTDVNSINIAEGCAPSGINNAIRQVMADLKDFQQGTKGDPFLGPVTPSTLTLTGLAANRILYTNGSKVVSTSDNVQFDGTTLTVNTLSATSITSVGGSINGMTIGASTASTGNFTTLGATGVATFSAGTVSAPAITTTGDTNTGIFFPAADTIAFTEGGVESMRIDSVGNVGIGVTPVTYTANARTLQIDGAANPAQIRLTNNTSGSSQNNGGLISMAGNDFYLWNVESSNLIFGTADAERMRIDSTGGVFLGVSSGNYKFVVITTNNTAKIGLLTTGLSGSEYPSVGYNVRYTTTLNTYTYDANDTASMIRYGSGRVETFTAVSGIAGNTISFTQGPFVALSGTSWTNGSSDVRQKKNFETSQGLSELLQIEPVKYHFLADDDNSPKRLGFKAQNLLSIIPEMVVEKSDLAEDGTPYLTITPDYLLPVLVKAMQEQQAMIETLTSRLNTLEGK